MGGVSEEVLLARAYLNRVAEPANVPLWALVRKFGPVVIADAVRRGDVSQEVAKVTAARRLSADPHADLEAAERYGIRFLVPESSEWPHLPFGCLERAAIRRVVRWREGDRSPSRSGELVPPLGLWVRGTLPLVTLSLRSVAIVGSRTATDYGDRIAKDLAYGMAMRDFDVVSGGAFGIDAAAHRGVLAADGRTVIVSARGLDEPYPLAHRALFDRVAESGALVSESPPGATPQRQRFLSRNRLIAALGTGTVVVEAAPRSGALNTAGHCLKLGRTLMAVPGPVTSSMSAGAHALIRRDTDPAHLVTGLGDVLALIGGAGDLEIGRDVGDGILDRLDDVARRVLEGFPAREAMTVDSLAVTSGISRPEVTASLPLLLRFELVSLQPDGSYILNRATLNTLAAPAVADS